MNVKVFDIETVPDTDFGRRYYNLPSSLTDLEVVSAMEKLRIDENGSPMQRLHAQKVVAISIVLKQANQIKVWSLGDESSQEAEIITRFYKGIDRYSPTLVTWNGSGFDLPVLHYRSMLHKIQAGRYWEMGEQDSNFKWNNYISRYHLRHTDLMDLLALYNLRAAVPLDQMATLLGYPGKMGMDGSKVAGAYYSGDVKAIRDYCETDVLNTYLVYLRYLHTSGKLSAQALEDEEDLLREYLIHDGQAHFGEFLDVWASLEV